jgi:hypothetical protein
LNEKSLIFGVEKGVEPSKIGNGSAYKGVYGNIKVPEDCTVVSRMLMITDCREKAKSLEKEGGTCLCFEKQSDGVVSC